MAGDKRHVHPRAGRADGDDDGAEGNVDPDRGQVKTSCCREGHDMFVSTRRKFLPDLTELGKTRPVLQHQQGMTIKHLAPLGPCCVDGPPVDVTTWRLCRLLESGFPQD